MPVLMYSSETMLWMEKERSRMRGVQMDNLRRLLDIRRMSRVPNARIRQFCGVKKGLEERIDEGVFRWFGHVERMERDRIAKRVYVGECAGSRSVGRPRKRWIDIVKECLRKRGLDVGEARRMVQNRSEWRGFVRRNAWGVARGDELLTLMKCHSCGLPQLYEAHGGWKSVCGRGYNLKDIKAKFLFFFSFLSSVPLLL